MNKNADGVVNIMNIIPEESEAESGDTKVNIFLLHRAVSCEYPVVYWRSPWWGKPWQRQAPEPVNTRSWGAPLTTSSQARPGLLTFSAGHTGWSLTTDTSRTRRRPSPSSTAQSSSSSSAASSSASSCWSSESSVSQTARWDNMYLVHLSPQTSPLTSGQSHTCVAQYPGPHHLWPLHHSLLWRHQPVLPGADVVLQPDLPLPHCLVGRRHRLEHEGGALQPRADHLLLCHCNPQSDPHHPHYPQLYLLENVKTGRWGKTFKEPTEEKHREGERSHNLYVGGVLIFVSFKIIILHQ